MNEIHGPQYKPSSVTVERREGGWVVVDRSYAGAEHVSGPMSYGLAMHRARVRRATIKGALTRRRNKHLAARRAACEAAGVTWEWLTVGEYNLSPAEADAWLGIDS